METKFLNKYIEKGIFNFKPQEDLKIKCNAPTNRGGIYLIYEVKEEGENLIYIGSSGQKKDGKLKVRQSGLGGMKDRLVNGYHPKFERFKRRKIFPQQMIKEGISEIKIYWWVTYDNNGNNDFPTDIESRLRNSYTNKFNCLPKWHK